MTIYLDLNIFDRIEKFDSLQDREKFDYELLINYLSKQNIDIPYSNAHLNDLFRGWKKNQKFIDGHLKNIQKLTDNLCICQYWGQNKVWWHKRDIFEFFNSKIEEFQFEDETFEEFLDMGIGFKNPIYAFKTFPLPEEWMKQMGKDELSKMMFPLSINENSLFNLFADLYNFQIRLKKDYSLYKSYKVQLSKTIAKLKNNKDVINAIRNNDQIPKHLKLDIFSISELYKPKFEIKENNNEDYYKIIETFQKFDLEGYKSDSNYNNMFDDGLHTFYASHCDIFITNDERCKFKAEKTFEKLKINTIVVKSNEINQLEKFIKQV